MKAKTILLISIIALVAIGGFYSFSSGNRPKAPKRVYWFIPDGLRAEPDLFTLYRWAEEGKLPHIKKMMEEGAYGYSIPDFPSHTPTNFASLLTGAHPVVHGIADGPMHVEDYPLSKPSVSGFSSVSKKVDPIWKILEAAGKTVALLSIPGSTPPELERGITIRGRWGGWGADTPAVMFESAAKLPERKSAGKAFKLFFLGPKLTDFVEERRPSGWKDAPQSFSPAKEATLESYGLKIFTYIYDSTDDQKTNYDAIRFSLDKAAELVTLEQGAWSEWRDAALRWQEKPFDSQLRIKIVKLWPETGNFRIRVFFNNVNKFIAQPPGIAEEMTRIVGPMVDFADNWPAQLVYEEEDKQTFYEEAMASLEWHKKAAAFILDGYKPDVLIQDTYTPNQMLESRWWMKRVEPRHPDYDPAKAADAWNDILEMYKGIDAILGEAMKNTDDETLIILSSDHGIAPLVKQVRLNNLFAKKGWLRFTVHEKTGEPSIDWENTRVIYMKMAHVYVNPNGLSGNWKRGSGPAYETLRNEVIQAIAELKDADGTSPLVHAAKWEDAPRYFELPADRVGDVVLEVAQGYQWWEEVTGDLKIFETPLGSGYKQANSPKEKPMWTPFVIMGPGVKKGYKIKEPISHVDQMPTILRLLGVPLPNYVQGRVLEEILR